MSTIGSFVEEIVDLRIEPMPSGKVMRNATVLRYDEVIVVVPAKGTVIYSPNVSKGVYYAIGEWPWTDGMMRGLCRLGVISEQSMQAHMAHVAQVEADRERAFDLARMEKYALKYGFELTSEQAEAMKCEPAN